MDDMIKSVWSDWRIVSPIGIGSYGTVYRAVHTRDSNRLTAIKVISIPGSESELDSLRHEGLSEEETRTYFSELVNDFISEIRVMELLRDAPNVVHVEDYAVIEKKDAVGWDIHIRMEYLTPFNAFVCDKTLTEADVIQLGCDLCAALEVCEQHNIIHRDIKPENILVNAAGEYKLGDFGIARKLEHMTFGMSQKGTVNYMAPEVMYSYDYDGRADIYSLGLVLYRLLNRNRLPFMDTEKQLLNPQDRRSAIDSRMRGEVLPPPCQASSSLADVILRACAFAPENRFPSAVEMKKALLDAANVIGCLPRRIGAAENVPASGHRKQSANRGRRKVVAAAIACLVIAGAVMGGLLYRENRQTKNPADSVGVEPISNATDEPLNDPVEDAELYLHTLPEKQEYFVGDSILESEIGLAIKRGNNTDRIEQGYSISPSVFTEAGEQTVTITYEGKSVSFTVTVQERICVGIEVIRLPIKTEYTVGDPLAVEGLILAKVWNDGKHETIAGEFVCTPDIVKEAGQQAITVTYENMQTEFYVTVGENGSIE